MQDDFMDFNCFQYYWARKTNYNEVHPLFCNIFIQNLKTKA